MLERYDPKLEVFAFYGCFHELYFWVLGRFACLVRTLTCLRDMTRNSSFSRFMAVFMIYCPLFWGSREIYNDLRPNTCLTVMTKNSSFSCFMFIFTNYCPLFWVLEGFTCLRRT